MIQERRDLKPRIPIREINAEDMLQNFRSNLLYQCGTDLAALYQENKGNRHVWVYDDDGDVLGVVLFVDKREIFYISAVTNNFAIPRENRKAWKCVVFCN